MPKRTTKKGKKKKKSLKKVEKLRCLKEDLIHLLRIGSIGTVREGAELKRIRNYNVEGSRLLRSLLIPTGLL